MEKRKSKVVANKKLLQVQFPRPKPSFDLGSGFFRDDWEFS